MLLQEGFSPSSLYSNSNGRHCQIGLQAACFGPRNRYRNKHFDGNPRPFRRLRSNCCYLTQLPQKGLRTQTNTRSCLQSCLISTWV